MPRSLVFAVALLMLCTGIVLPTSGAWALPASPSCRLRSHHLDGRTAEALTGAPGLQPGARYPVYSCVDGSWAVFRGTDPIVLAFGPGSTKSALVVYLAAAGRLRVVVQQRTGQRVVHTAAFGAVHVATFRTLGYNDLGPFIKGTSNRNFPLVHGTIHMFPGQYTVFFQQLGRAGKVVGASLPIVIAAMRSGSIVIVTGQH